MIGPVQLEAKIHFRVGGQLGSATFGFPVGQAVSEKDILAAIGQALTSIREQFDQVQLLEPEAFFNEVLVPEKTGGHRGNFALPNSFDYDPLKLEADAFAAMQEDPA